jgi:serine/threonine protein kinase
MLFDKIKERYNSLDNFVSKIGDKFPVSMRVDALGRTLDKESMRRKYERIFETFRKHKPPIIVGQYIGSGGFADVYYAQSEYEAKTDFVIKILKNELLEIRKGQDYDPEEEEMRVKDLKKRFKNESYVQWDLSQSLSDMVADSVVKVYDHGEFDSKNEFRFILMERMGSTVRDFILDPESRSSDESMVRYKSLLIRTIAEGIRNIHSDGILHRDIKPENILFPLGVTPAVDLSSPQVKLGDFGTVRWIKAYSSHYDGVIIGSQFYISPEQIFDPDNLDWRTDIYSFGVVCYEILYGSHPKDVQQNTPNLLYRLATEKPIVRTPPPRFERLNEIIFRCMNDIDIRYQSMEQVLKDINEFLDSISA